MQKEIPDEDQPNLKEHQYSTMISGYTQFDINYNIMIHTMIETMSETMISMIWCAKAFSTLIGCSIFRWEDMETLLNLNSPVHSCRKFSAVFGTTSRNLAANSFVHANRFMLDQNIYTARRFHQAVQISLSITQHQLVVYENMRVLSKNIFFTQRQDNQHKLIFSLQIHWGGCLFSPSDNSILTRPTECPPIVTSKNTTGFSGWRWGAFSPAIACAELLRKSCTHKHMQSEGVILTQDNGVIL